MELGTKKPQNRYISRTHRDAQSEPILV